MNIKNNETNTFTEMKTDLDNIMTFWLNFDQ